MMILNDGLLTNLLVLLLNPGIFLIIFSLLSLSIRNNNIKFIFITLPIISGILLTLQFIGEIPNIPINFLGNNFLVFEITNWSFIISIAFQIVFLCLILFCSTSKDYQWLYKLSGIICGSAIVAINAQDYITLFLGIELLSIASILLIFIDTNDKSFAIGFRYAIIHIFSGILLLIGIISQIKLSGNYNISLITIANIFTDEIIWNEAFIGKLLILIALLINCAVPPFSNWLTDTYSNTNPYSAVILSSFGTKVAIFSLLKIFAGNEIILYVAVVTMLYSAILALASGNMRQILSYSIINKLGLMMIGISIGTPIAQFAVVFLIFSHLIYNLLLFCVIGKLNLSYGVNALNEVLIFDKKIWIFLLIGIFSATSLPLTNGYIAKTLLFISIADNNLLYLITLALVIPSIAAFCKLLLPYFRKQDLIITDTEDWKKNEVIALSILSFILLVTGIDPSIIFSEYSPHFDDIFNPSQIIIQLIIVLIILAIIYIFRKYLVRNNAMILDFDWIIRGVLYKFYYQSYKLLSSYKKNILAYLSSYANYSILRYCKDVISPVWGVSLIINSFIVSLILLFLLIYI